jgi:hypothetical protein
MGAEAREEGSVEREREAVAMGKKEREERKKEGLSLSPQDRKEEPHIFPVERIDQLCSRTLQTRK